MRLPMIALLMPSSVTVADDRWAEASSTSGPPDTGLYYDTIEVIDWQRGQVVASERFDLTYSWIQPGLLGKLEITAKGSVRYRTYRVQLDGHVGAALLRNETNSPSREE